ncbi:MAG: sensor histidine kinase [Gammaproteobacteria bacterium]
MVRALPDTANAAGSARGGDAHTWKPLRFFNIYRLVLAGLFAVAYFASPTPPEVFGMYAPRLFETVCLSYLAFAIVASLAHQLRWPGFASQVYIEIVADIIAITLLMHASGGVESSLGVLLVISIAAGALLLPGRLAILFAALAALAVLLEQTLAAFQHQGTGGSFTQAGILGSAYFATAIIAYLLARRIRESEALAAQRGADLANLERLNETIIRHLDAGVLVVDHGNRIRLINEAAHQLLGIPGNRAIASLHAVSAELADRLQRWQHQPAAEPETFRPGAQRSALQPRFTRLGSGARSGILVFLHDTAQLAQKAQQMKLASLGRLTASIAHEIRNPLGAISHAAQLLSESAALAKDERRLTEIIGAQAARVNTIVENVLQLSRGKPSQSEPIRIAEWLHAFAAEFAGTHHLAPACVQVTVADPVLEVRLDPTHLHQVLWNLCENALQYGNTGRTTPQVGLSTGVDPASGAPYLDVTDPGPGIPPDIAEQIFEPFYTRSTHGTGLGLYIARELCELNQASLDYRVTGEGQSCFRIAFRTDRASGAN